MTAKISLIGVKSMLQECSGNGGGGPMIMKVELEVMVVLGKMVEGTVPDEVGTTAPAPILLNIIIIAIYEIGGEEK